MNTTEPLFRSAPISLALLPLLLLFVVTVGPGCNGPKPSLHTLRPGMHEVVISGNKLWTYIAADTASRQRGLMHRSSLPEDVGMLFIFAEPKVQGFWMKNCVIDLDIAYIDDEGFIIDILQMKAPTPGQVILPRYRSSKPVRYALEANVGWFSAHGIEPGTKVSGYKGRPGLQVR